MLAAASSGGGGDLADVAADDGHGRDNERHDDAFGDSLGQCAPGGVWRDVDRKRDNRGRLRFGFQTLEHAGD